MVGVGEIQKKVWTIKKRKAHFLKDFFWLFKNKTSIMLIDEAKLNSFWLSLTSVVEILLISKQNMHDAPTASLFVYFSVTLATHFVVQAAPTLECHHLNQEKRLLYQIGNSILTLNQHVDFQNLRDRRQFCF